MIQLLEQLEPAVTLSWAVYEPLAEIGWLHGENKELTSPDQVAPSRGPASVIPTAIFSLETYPWEVVEW